MGARDGAGAAIGDRVRRLALVLLALGAVGCGGSDDRAQQPSVTPAAWAGQARTICLRAEDASKRMVAAVQRERVSALAHLDEMARRQGGLDARRMRRLRALARPTHDARRIDELLDRIEAADATLVSLASAFHTDAFDDDRAVEARLTAMAPALKRLAAALGVPECVPGQIRRS
jgi:hypothetical protein